MNNALNIVRCLSVWSVCGCHTACAFIKPQILVVWWLRAQALQTSCFKLNYGFVMYLMYDAGQTASGCLSFPICKMVIVISCTSQSCHWDSMSDTAVVGRIMVASKS